MQEMESVNGRRGEAGEAREKALDDAEMREWACVMM